VFLANGQLAKQEVEQPQTLGGSKDHIHEKGAGACFAHLQAVK
jgi:hypothetical protein